MPLQQCGGTASASRCCLDSFQQVVGIWFYDDADCDRISVLLQRIASTFAAPAEAAAGATVRACCIGCIACTKGYYGRDECLLRGRCCLY